MARFSPPPATRTGSYHVTGTQLTGLVTVGEDDYQNPQNFPVVYLKDSAGNIRYARSFNFSTMRGTPSLYVSACGISSSTGYSFSY
jgi:hypothetical protein